jgi:enoyl-CoA hydratase
MTFELDALAARAWVKAGQDGLQNGLEQKLVKGRMMEAGTDYTQVLTEMRGRTLWVTLNAPPLNPVSWIMQAELAEILHRANSDAQVKALVLTGAGQAFSAGGDIVEMKEKATDLARQMALQANGVDLVHSLLQLRKPIIGRLNGHAIGLGASIALLCDITVATTKAKIGDPHVRMGLAAGDGGALIWPFLVGFARAKEYLMTGNLIPAPKAAEMGLINHAVAPEELDAKVSEFATWFEEGPGMAISATKIAINMFLRQYGTLAADAHMRLEAQTVFSADHFEAVDAFIEKREPKFK